MSLERIITHDEADYELLKLANEKGKFALQLNHVGDENIQHAFERGIDAGWFTFVDVSPLAALNSSALFRMFKLTLRGRRRLTDLRRQFCDHRDYEFERHGRHCYCGVLMTDFGD